MLDNKALYELLNGMTDNNYINANRKVVFLRIKPNKKKKKRNYDVLLGVLYEFLLSTGVNCDIYNWSNQHFVLITKLESFIDRKAILDRFSDVISEVGEQMAKDVIEGIKKEYLPNSEL